MIPTLRPYQEELRQTLNVAWSYIYHSVILVLSTGAGKTTIFTQVLKDAELDGMSVWVIAHRQELVRQASKTLDRFEVTHGIIKAGELFDPQKITQVASIQTLVRRLQKLNPPDLIIADECHHTLSASWKKVFDAFSEASLLGVTATPIRTNGAGLGQIFQHMVQGPSNTWLTEQGYLCPARYFAPPVKADLSNVPTRGGDYAAEALEEVMDENTITGDAIAHYKRICEGVPMLVCCTSIVHASHVAEEYRKAGYRAVSVDGTMSDEDREDRITGLGTGKYQVLTFCDLIGEGLDVPAATAIQFLRPTKSLILHLQFIGRVLRAIYGEGYDIETTEGRLAGIANGPKPCAYILDHVGNTSKHNFASTDRQWSLEGTKKKKSGETAPAIRTCGDCFSVHKTSKTCPYCGYEYPVKTKSLTSLKTVDGQLVEVEQTKEERLDEVRAAKTFPELKAIAIARGYKRPHFWALKTFRNRRPDINVLPRL